MACNQEDLTGKVCHIEGVNGDPTSVIGKWRLLSEQWPFVSFEVIQYSCEQVLYEFREDGALIISSKRKIPETSIAEYFYKIFEDSLPGKPSNTIEINHMKMAIQISAKELILDGSNNDGPVRKLVRVSLN